MTIDSVYFFVSIASLICAVIPAALVAINLRRYRPAPTPLPGESLPAVSILIPARNEAESIGATLQAALSTRGIAFEIVVLDDHSDDETRRIVSEFAEHDERVRCVQAPPLPAGWSGKQHACWTLAHLARYPLLMFVDADVRLSPDASASAVNFLKISGAELVSGIPRQETRGFLECLLIPLIHFVLLGFLPIGRMRRIISPAYAAGCGQLFLTPKDAYRQVGGHSAIRTTFHDGIMLPRAYRKAGLKTDLFDATSVATCRMYRSASDLWNGLAKNATEGLAAPRLLIPMTIILALGQIAPFFLLPWGLGRAESSWQNWTVSASALALIVSLVPRLAMAVRYNQSKLGAVLHPLGVSVLLVIQWYSWVCKLCGRQASWKGRTAPTPGLPCEAIPFLPLDPEHEGIHEPDRPVETSTWG